MKGGQLSGTRANAYLQHKEYSQATAHFQRAIEAFDSVTGAEESAALENRVTAVNGIGIALGRLGREDEAIALFRRELKQEGLSIGSICSLTINLCNRLVLLHQDSLKKGDEVFTEVCRLLDSVGCHNQLGHEARGSVYCAYGMVYSAVEDNVSAREYYRQAKEEFLIVNSQHLAEVEWVLAQLAE